MSQSVGGLPPVFAFSTVRFRPARRQAASRFRRDSGTYACIAFPDTICSHRPQTILREP